MCGITGILNFKNRVDRDTLSRMTDKLIHRGPDGGGIWFNEQQNLGFGHRRLSIIDLSNAGAQPMHYQDRYTITYNGEIYNYIELRTELEAKGYSFTSHTDTEVILASYAEKGKKCLQDFDGMFAFAIWDSLEEKLFCARDRFGEKPFFYSVSESSFSFASEIKAFWESEIKKQVNYKYVYDYLLFGTTQSITKPESTFYENVLSLEPAFYLEVSKTGNIQKKRYWDINFQAINTRLSIDEAKEEFYALFKDSVSKRLRSDVPVGSSLSGGIDSSSIVSLIHKIRSKDQIQKTFSARFENFSRDEGPFINEVIKGKDNIDAYNVYPTEQSVLDRLDKIIYHQDEPFGSLSIAAQYEVMETARKNNVIVMLDGQGADEYLAGYTVFFDSYYQQLHRENKGLYTQELRAYKELYGKDFEPLNPFSKLKSFSEFWYQKAASIRRSFTNSKSDYFAGIHPDIVDQFKTHRNPRFQPADLKEHLHASTTRKGLSELLRYADRNSMAHSLEVRLPFLNHKLVEYTFSLPPEYLIHNAWTKYVLRESMEGILPKAIQWRKDKIGFEPPQGRWLETKFFKDMLGDSISKLKEHNIIISTPNPELYWKYIMIAKYM